jgi:hypothetical protein
VKIISGSAELNRVPSQSLGGQNRSLWHENHHGPDHRA